MQTGWQRASLVWTLPQLPGESVVYVLEYIAKLQRTARDSSLPEEHQRHAIIHGLRPAIRSHVLRQNPNNLAALRQAALITEQTEPSQPEENGQAMERIERQLQQLTLHSLQTNSVDRQRPLERTYDNRYPYSSPSPSREPRPAERRSYDPSHRYSSSSHSPPMKRRRPSIG